MAGWAASRPDDLALACGERALTWAELAAEVDALAGWLASVAAPGERVAFVAGNTAEWVVAYYAVPKAGLRLGFVNQRLGAPALRAAVARFAPGGADGRRPGARRRSGRAAGQARDGRRSSYRSAARRRPADPPPFRRHR